MMNKEIIIRLFNIRTYESEYNELITKYENIKKAQETVKMANDILARDVIDLEKTLEVIAEEPAKYVEQEVINKWADCIEVHEDKVKRAYHRGIAIGRRSAYSELGVIVYDAHQEGKDVAVIEDGNHFGVLADDLVTLEGDVNSITLPDEIEIEDLLRLE